MLVAYATDGGAHLICPSCRGVWRRWPEVSVGDGLLTPEEIQKRSPFQLAASESGVWDDGEERAWEEWEDELSILVEDGTLTPP